MTDLDMLRDALASRASRAPDTDVVLANTTESVRRRRTRRRATALAGTVAVATGALVTGVALVDQAPADQAQPGRPEAGIQAATSASAQVLPESGHRPKLPFTVTVPAGYQLQDWSVGDTSAITHYKGGAGQLEVALLDRLGPNPENTEKKTTVRGIPAVFRVYASGRGLSLTWEIAPGRWALVAAADEQQSQAVADSVTLTPSDPPAAGRLTDVPAGLSVIYWGRGNVGMTTVMLCPDKFTDKNQCAVLNLDSGTAPDKVNTKVQGQQAPLSAPDAAGVRQTPDGETLVRQIDPGNWAQASTGTSISAKQLREIILAAAAG
ncbi:MAG: hypothetical protein ABW215_03840 [Kibdelosporangium sp.]